MRTIFANHKTLEELSWKRHKSLSFFLSHAHKSWDSSSGTDSERFLEAGLLPGTCSYILLFNCCLTASGWGMCFLWHRKWEVKGPRPFLSLAWGRLQKCSVTVWKSVTVTSCPHGQRRGKTQERKWTQKEIIYVQKIICTMVHLFRGCLYSSFWVYWIV